MRRQSHGACSLLVIACCLALFFACCGCAKRVEAAPEMESANTQEVKADEPEPAPEAVEAFTFVAGMAIDADGCPRAYHPDAKSGLDHLANGGKPGDWWGVVTANGKPSGEPVVQGDDDPAPGFYVSQTALFDPDYELTDPRRYVDACEIPYIVLPLDDTRGAGLGDFAMVINHANGRRCGAIFADLGPGHKLGEGSIALAECLGVKSSPKHGGTDGGIMYIVFPGSGNGRPQPGHVIQQRAGELYEIWERGR